MAIHYKLFKDGEPYYLCNQAVSPSKDKMTKDWRKITCKNCLKQKSKWD